MRGHAAYFFKGFGGDVIDCRVHDLVGDLGPQYFGHVSRQRVLLCLAAPGDAPHSCAKRTGSVGKEFGDISAKLSRQNKQVMRRYIGLTGFDTGHRGFGHAANVGDFGQCHPSCAAKV